MASREVVINASDNLIEVRRVRNTATNAILNGATVTAEVKDSLGSSFTGFTNPITLSEVGSTATYRGTFPVQDVNETITVGDVLTVEVIINGGAGLYRTLIFKAEVKA